MRLKINSGVHTYYCIGEEKPHYEVESDFKITIEHMYAFPYAVDNYESSKDSRVYRWENNKWKFIREFNRLAPEPQLQLREKLRIICGDM